MSASRPISVLPVPTGTAVRQVFGALTDVLADRGPAVLPVPADDPARARLLVDALDPGSPVEDACSLVVTTSGSTGEPKGAMLSAAALRASACATEKALSGPGVWMLALPTHHIAGLQVVLRSLRSGYEPAIVDVAAGFDPETLIAAAADCADRRGTCGQPVPRYTSLVPGQLLKVLDGRHPEAVSALSEFDAVLVGGAAVDPALLDQARQAGIRMVRTYGMSETAGGCVYDGRPLDGVAVEIDDSSRIWISGPQVALGYRRAPGHEAFARPGWFRTDDAGEFADDGRLRVLGRLDDALSVGGLTILPQVVEEALRRHRSVEEAVVVGVPDQRLGTRPVAAVTVCGGCMPPSERELKNSVTERLGGHSAPAHVVVVPDLPLLPGGKIDRPAVARAFREGTVR